MDAALVVADEAGWGGMSLLQIAENAGYSRMTAKAHFPDRSAIGAAVWTRRLADPLAAALTAVIDACPTPGDPPDVQALQSALTPFMEPVQTMRAAAELLLVGRYDPAVSAAVTTTLRPVITEWLTVKRGRLTRTDAARRAYLLILALGLLTHARRSPVPAAELITETAKVSAALTSTHTPTRLPPDRLRDWAAPIDFGTADPAWERLLQATLDQVGTLGYEAATIGVITKAAGCTSGLMFARYDSKWDLFVDATDRTMAATVNANQQYYERIAQRYGEGIAEANIMREMMVPEASSQRTVSLEQYRVSWHDQAMLAKMAASYTDATWTLSQTRPETPTAHLRAHLHFGLALGVGVGILPELHPDVWRLPMDVVTVPLLGTTPHH